MDCDDGEDFMVRKSSRRKKTNVRLHLLGDSDDSGEDFAPPPPSISRKRKSSTHKNNASSEQQDKINTVPSSKRLSRDEKLFNRALEQAMTESVSPSSLDRSHQGGEGAGKENKNISDYEPEDSTEEEEGDDNGGEDDDDDDDDFEIQPTTNKTKKSESEPKRKAKAPPKDIPDKAITPARNGMVEGGVSPAVSSPSSVASGNRKCVPKWVPPTRIGGTTGKSPGTAATKHSTGLNGGGTPVIRVGLSRKAQIKPLHRVQKLNSNS